MKYLTQTFYCVVVLLFSHASISSADSLKSMLDRNAIGKDETVQLTVRYSGSSQRGEPNFSSLDQQFEILSTSKSNHMQSVNGRFTSHTDWLLTLLPKEEGKLLIPSFQYAGQVSDALALTVSKPQEAPKGTLKNVFIETLVDQDSVYVQQQLIVKYRLYYAVNLESVETEPLELENVLQEKLPESRYSRSIKNRRYSIAEFGYALFPQTSGTIEIPSLTWDIKIPKSGRSQNYFGFSGRYEISRQRTDAKTITVKPRPEAFPKDKPWIPATSLSLSESWSKSPSSFKVGEPSTRTITMTAEGLMASQLPQIWDGHESATVKSYADKPELDDEKNDSGLSSSRVESAAVVVTENGSSTLPAVKIPWWDVTSDSLKYAEIAAQTLSATGANASSSIVSNNSPSSVIPQAADGQENSALKTAVRTWQIISFVLAMALIGVTFLLFGKNKTQSRPVKSQHNNDEKAALVQLKKACNANDASGIRVALLAWSRYRWPEAKIKNLSDIVKKIKDDNFRQEIINIDASLYSNQPEARVDGSAIFACLQQHTKGRTKDDLPRDGLQGFYAQ